MKYGNGAGLKQMLIRLLATMLYDILQVKFVFQMFSFNNIVSIYVKPTVSCLGPHLLKTEYESLSMLKSQVQFLENASAVTM